MAVQIQLRRGTASEWTSANPILAQGEFGYESDTSKFKVGNGTASWSALSYAVGGGLDEATAAATYIPISASPTLGGGSSASVSSGIIETSVLISPEERFNIVSGSATGTINIDTNTSTAWLYNLAGYTNFTINVRGDASTSLNSILDTGDAITVGVINTTSTTASAFFANAYQVDGAAVTPKWLNNSEPPSSLPLQSSAGYDAYTLTLIKTASAEYTALGSWSQYR